MIHRPGRTVPAMPISRRGVLRGASAIGAAAALGPLAAGRAAAQEPKRGGVLRLGMGAGNTTDSYDPATWDNQFVQVFAAARCGYLTEVAADGSVVGEVAESWEPSADAKTWRFQLRPGVTFHSGKAVAAEDVIASIAYHRGEDSTSAAKPIVDPITDMRADGPDAVVFTLASGNADFAFIMSDFHLAILPAVDGAIDPTTSDGCGGYVVDAFEPGVAASLTRYPDYWKPDAAWFDGIEMIAILDGAARQNALIGGEVDAIDRVDFNTVRLLERAPGIEVLATDGTQHYVFPMDTRTAPFDDNDVRLAMKYAVNRQEMVDKILSGYGRIGNDHPIGRSNPYYAEGIEQHVYDPDRARFHLEKAGLDGLSVQLSAAEAAFAGAVEASVLYAAGAAAAGIEIEVVQEPSDGYFSNVWMQKPFVASYWGGRPTEDWMFSTAYETGVPWNEAYWSDARFDELLLQARSELDEAKRAEMYAEMQRIVSQEGGTVIPMFANYVMAHSDQVATPDVVGANWTLDGFRAVERWWFA